MTTSKPYFIRALHEWCTDHNLTPYLGVWVDERVSVPMEYVKDNEIVLNISYDATRNLVLGNELIQFSARFGGISHDLWIPVSNVTSIFARETSEGMGFELLPLEDDVSFQARQAESSPLHIANEDDVAELDDEAPPPKTVSPLRIVK